MVCFGIFWSGQLSLNSDFQADGPRVFSLSPSHGDPHRVPLF